MGALVVLLFLFVFDFTNAYQYYQYYINSSATLCEGSVSLNPNQNITFAVDGGGNENFNLDIVFTSSPFPVDFYITYLDGIDNFEYSFVNQSVDNFANVYSFANTQYIMISNPNQSQVNVTYSIELKPLKFNDLMFLTLAAFVVIFSFFFGFLRRCTCCCPGRAPKGVRFVRFDGIEAKFVYEYPPRPLFHVISSRIYPFTSKFIKKPVVSFMVYCLNSNDLLWIFFPSPTETLSFIPRLLISCVIFLFIITFQLVWFKELIIEASNFGSFSSFVVSSIGGLVIITVLKNVLKSMLRLVSFRTRRMLFADSENNKKIIIGRILNYLFIVILAGLSGLCIYEDYKQGIVLVWISLIILLITLTMRLFFFWVQFAFYRLFASIGAMPNVLLEWNEHSKVYYMKRTNGDSIEMQQREANTKSSSSTISLHDYLAHQPYLPEYQPHQLYNNNENLPLLQQQKQEQEEQQSSSSYSSFPYPPSTPSSPHSASDLHDFPPSLWNNISISN